MSNKVSVKALRAFLHGRTVVRVGSVFEVSQGEAKSYQAARLVERIGESEVVSEPRRGPAKK